MDENGWLEYDRVLLGWPFFRGELLVSWSMGQKYLQVAREEQKKTNIET